MNRLLLMAITNSRPPRAASDHLNDRGNPVDRLLSTVMEIAPLSPDEREYRNLSRHMHDLIEETGLREDCLHFGQPFDERLATPPIPAPDAPLIGPQPLTPEEKRRLDDAFIAYYPLPPATPDKAGQARADRRERERKAHRKAQKAARRHH